MSSLRSFAAVAAFGLRGIPARLGTSLVIVIGVAIVVSVFVSVLALAASFRKSAESTGRPDHAVILRDGTSTESGSSLSRTDVLTILNAPGIVSAGGKPIASADSLAFVPLADKRSGRNSFATLRGIGLEGMQLRPQIRLTQGRLFKPGMREIIAGKAALARLKGLSLGSRISLPQGEWQIVGVFESRGDSHESELLTDAETLMTAYHKNEFNSLTVALDSPAGLERLKAALAGNPTLTVDVIPEDKYFARASQSISDLLLAIAFGIGGIMAFGTSFGAVNTMYAVVSTRTIEIATLRAIGFGTKTVVASVLVESMILAAAGALIGSELAWLVFNGMSVSTLAGGAPSEVAFTLHVAPNVMGAGVTLACLIGFLGGFFPAARAGRQTVASALRG